MTAEAKASSGALVLAPEQGVTYNLDAFPEDRFNRLVPTQTIRMPSDLIVPVVQVVQLDIENDTYESRDIKKGHRAPARTGLRKLATAAAISIVDVQRTDDGSNPAVCAMRAVAEMTLPTGQRIRAVGTKSVDLDSQSWASSSQRAKYASFFAEHVASRAENRAIRALLSLRSSYPVADLRKPFAVVTYAPNMDHPEVRRRILDAMAPTVQQLYGPPDAPQLAAGAEVVDVGEAPDDEPEARYVEAHANGGTHTVDAETGEVVATTDEGPDFGEAEPDWAADVAGEAPGLAERLQRVAQANGRERGPATNEQRAAVKGALRGLSTGEATAVLADTFGIKELSDIQQRHAQAILEVGAAMGHEALVAEWKALAAELAA